MNRKMKRTFLDFETKAEVIKKIKIGVEKEEILQKYEIGESSYYKFLRHESEIMNTLKKPENKHRRLFKKLKNEYLDDAVIKWFQQTRDRGVLVTGPMIREKAKVFNEKLNGPANFKASSGWLSKLKKRYNIKCSDIKGESFTYSTECIEEFSKSLKKKIINEKLLLENIYNADEAGIYWRTIVSAIQLEKLQGNNLFHLNNSNDLITVLFCSNASGNHRIPLLLIVNEDESACLENLLSNDENSEGKKKSCLNELSSLGIIYANQENSRICQKIFKDWFEEIFIPRALDFQRDSKISGKILLILDNAPCHPAIDELNAINKNIEVIEIPANVSAQLRRTHS
ncbi:jerky protein homolog-like [Leptopilina heterotoma]|uniref:jerky protein homolog-like n=1 Tax=Leptopilina heterotoma TaxID=63436 RepID=UPI001CA883D6|nr:jerky protein homolog-like [Leptopilina heterotoma]